MGIHRQPTRSFSPPPGVVARQSSDVMAIDDDDVVAALRWIHDASHRPVQVGDLLREIPISRRMLERKSRKLRSSAGTSLFNAPKRISSRPVA
jgi:LacI family transcriptional regulator